MLGSASSSANHSDYTPWLMGTLQNLDCGLDWTYDCPELLDHYLVGWLEMDEKVPRDDFAGSTYMTTPQNLISQGSMVSRQPCKSQSPESFIIVFTDYTSPFIHLLCMRFSSLVSALVLPV